MIELPPILIRKNFKTQEEFIIFAYQLFIHDFIDYPPKLCRKTVNTLKQTMPNGYNKTFWHIITEGDHRESDPVVLDRLERLPWINPIIEGQPDDEWLMWEKPSERKTARTLIYSTKLRYLVVIEKRNSNNVVFWTAYPIDTNHQDRKLIKEYKTYSLANKVK